MSQAPDYMKPRAIDVDRIKAALSILLVLAAVLSIQGCTSEQPEEVEELESQVEQAAEEGSPAPAPEAMEVAELRPLDLPVERYVREMAKLEVERAYREPRGEFIDPRRVIELLREGAEEPPEIEDSGGGAAESGWSGRWPIEEAIHAEALELAEAGDIEGAVDMWRGLMSVDRALTISVEVDCSRAILSESMSTLGSLDVPVFLIPITVSDRGCMRLCLGLFSARGEASEWIEKIKLKLPKTVPFILEVRRGEW